MTEPIEREYKVLLTREEYEKLYHSYDFPITVEQTNQYFDTPKGMIKKLPGALRIREREGKKIFTLKIRNDATSNIELEKEISDEVAARLASDPQLAEWARTYGIPLEDLIPTYSVHTIRHILNTDNAEISLDETDFGSVRDYEIEYECKKPHDGLPAFNQILSTIGKHFEKNGPSKIARAEQYASEKNLKQN